MFLSHLGLSCLEPTSVCVVLLLAAAGLRKRKVAGPICFWLAVALLLVGGNGWVSGFFTWQLERQHLPPDPVPRADCILVLGGGTRAAVPPRSTSEVNEAGNRVLHGAWLYQEGKAPVVVCTGRGFDPYPEALDMAAILQRMGVPKTAILLETNALNTHEHALNLRAEFQQRSFKRVLLVTSALHMPRSLAVMKHGCPGVEFIPAPTDFRVVDSPAPWYREWANLAPTGAHFAALSTALHEYLGLAYYWLRGWL